MVKSKGAAVAQESNVALQEWHGEMRVDSRLMAEGLGIQHESVIKTLSAYADDFAQLGVFRFEIGKPGAGSRGGRPEQYAFLNEDQAYLLLTYSRNTAKVRELKLKLVLAFREARQLKAISDAHYLPFYHALHDEVATLAHRAHDAGSTADERVFHININKLANKVVGINSGERDRLDAAHKLMLTNVQAVIRQSLHASNDANVDHKTAYSRAKAAAISFVQAAGGWLIPHQPATA